MHRGISSSVTCWCILGYTITHLLMHYGIHHRSPADELWDTSSFVFCSLWFSSILIHNAHLPSKWTPMKPWYQWRYLRICIRVMNPDDSRSWNTWNCPTKVELYAGLFRIPHCWNSSFCTVDWNNFYYGFTTVYGNTYIKYKPVIMHSNAAIWLAKTDPKACKITSFAHHIYTPGADMYVGVTTWDTTVVSLTCSRMRTW